jgi:hypothetical protein
MQVQEMVAVRISARPRIRGASEETAVLAAQVAGAGFHAGRRMAGTDAKTLRPAVERAFTQAGAALCRSRPSPLDEADAITAEPFIDVQQEGGGCGRAGLDGHEAGQAGIGGVSRSEPFPVDEVE